MLKKLQKSPSGSTPSHWKSPGADAPSKPARAARHAGVTGLNVRTAAKAAVAKIGGKLEHLREAGPARLRSVLGRASVVAPPLDTPEPSASSRPLADPHERERLRPDGATHVQVGRGVPRPLADGATRAHPQRYETADDVGRPRPLPPTPLPPAALRLRAFEKTLAPPDALAWTLAWKDLAWLAEGALDVDRLRDDRADALARRDASALAGQAALLQELMHTMHRSRRVLFKRFQNQPNFADVQSDIEHQVDDAMAAFSIQLGPELDALAAARRQLAPPVAPALPLRPGDLHRETGASQPVSPAAELESGVSSFRWGTSSRSQAAARDGAPPAELEALPTRRR